jgi:hypothetical protein
MVAHIMQIMQIILLIGILLIGGWMLFFGALYYTQILKRKKIWTRSLLDGFRQKIWMTVGLGSFFFGSYLSILFCSSLFRDPKQRLDLFFYMYRHPTECIYLGLFVFTLATISIYLARMIIKYLYNRVR